MNGIRCSAYPATDRRRSTITEQEPKAAETASSAAGIRQGMAGGLYALVICNPISILSISRPDVIWGIEYGGLIYKFNGKYYFTQPIEGDDGGVDVWKGLPQIPNEAGNAVVGDYYTHGAGRLPGSGEDFSGFRESPAAKMLAARTGVNGDIQVTENDVATRREILDPKIYTAFLATPQGRFTLFIPSQQLVFSFSPDARLLPPGSKIQPAAYAQRRRAGKRRRKVLGRGT